MTVETLRAEIAVMRARGEVPVGTPFEHLLARAICEFLEDAPRPVPWVPAQHVSTTAVEHLRLALTAYYDGRDRLIEAQQARTHREAVLDRIERVVLAGAERRGWPGGIEG